MKLKKLTAKNYKSLEDIEINFNGNYCAISGRNNSGKSNIIHLITYLLGASPLAPWDDSIHLDFKSDCTQWARANSDSCINIHYEFSLNDRDDNGLIEFIKRFANKDIKYNDNKDLLLEVSILLSNSSELEYKVLFEKREVTPKDIIRRLRDSELLILHNSTKNMMPHFLFSGKTCFGLDYTKEEYDYLDKELLSVKKKVERISKSRKAKLEKFLGELCEAYTVEFSLMSSLMPSRHIPFDILLKNCNVQVPLSDWGSGTQNRTTILMNLMKAISNQDSDAVPIIVIEEPESFLHPSAQAEFGKILQKISKDHNIQIIVTTHSPHMLNITDPTCNILLHKPYGKLKKGEYPRTTIVDTSGDNWMAPFAEHLGLCKDIFSNWISFLGVTKQKVLFVEGDTDVKYLTHIRNGNFPCGKIPEDIEIISYNGAGTLSNSSLISFVLSKFDKTFILFDKDVEPSVIKCLNALNLKEKYHYMSVGIDKPGKRSIEGLLPDNLIQHVDDNNRELVAAERSDKKDEAKKAKSELKKLYCEEFCKRDNFSEEELKEFKPLIKQICKIFK